MKFFPTLPGAMRLYFRIARIAVVVVGAFWLQVITFGPWLQRQFVDEPKLMISVGDVMLHLEPSAIAPVSNTAGPGSLGLSAFRATLQMDLISNDRDLVSAIRWAAIPSIILLVAFAWVLFGSLGRVCSNIERGDVFSEGNLQMVRRIGISLIAYSVAAFLIGFWAAHVMGGYLDSHVTLTGVAGGMWMPAQGGLVGFLMPSGLLSSGDSFLVGLLVLVISEAFRRGLALKAENDLTV